MTAQRLYTEMEVRELLTLARRCPNHNDGELLQIFEHRRDNRAAALAESPVPAGHLLRKVLDTLEGQDCCFWACKGPDAPCVPMQTCNKCAAIKELRELAAPAVPVAEATGDDSDDLMARLKRSLDMHGARRLSGDAMGNQPTGDDAQ